MTMMTLMELQEMLGKQIKAIDEAIGGTKEFQYVMEKAEYMAKISKQMNNTADNIIRISKHDGNSTRESKIAGE